MLVVSVIIDICQIALNLVGVGEFINDICDIPIELGFYIWFKIDGVNFGSTRKMLAFLGTFAFGLGTDSVIPSWTLEIALMIAAIKAEDKLANISPIAKAVVSKASGGV